MDYQLFPLILFITWLPAGLSVWTQSRVTAQQGGLVSIPCRYDQKYKDSVKYWCKGVFWSTCIVLQKTNSTQRRAGLSITDDPAQQVFTVTMSRLQLRDTNKYWCAVEIKGIDTPDPKAGVFLTVTRGNSSLRTTSASIAAEKPPQTTTPSTASSGNAPPQTRPSAGLNIWTQSRVTAQQGGSVSISCGYDQKYKGSVKYWCKGVLWPTCIVLQKTSSTQRRAGLSITDDPAQQVFTVTMSRLQLRDTNKYWCAVEIKGVNTPDPKAGVFLTVTKENPPPQTTPYGVPMVMSTTGAPPLDRPAGKAPTGPFSPSKAGLSVWTQSRVSAQQGGSVSIPCRYDQKYKDGVKYWCKGVLWPTCIVLQKTNSTQRRAGLSITDDPAQQVFTVTMSRLQRRDTNKYWCAVEMKGVDTPDPKAGVFLTVTRGTATEPTTPSTLSMGNPPSASTSSSNAAEKPSQRLIPSTGSAENPPPQTTPSGEPTVMSPTEAPPFDRPTAGLSVWTQSRVSAQQGGSVSIPCRYDQKYKDGVKYWCKGVLWPTCIVLQKTNSTQRRAGLSITDDPAQQVFTVTMSRLQRRDTNKYWCAVEMKGVDTPDPKAGVFLTVTRGTATEPTTPSTLSMGNPPSASTSSSNAAEKPSQRLIPSTGSAENPPPQTTPSGEPTVMSPTEAPPFDRPTAGLSVWTQSRVSAQQGGSVSIPCRYDQKYKDRVKYWCKGVLWPTCIVLQKTNSPQRRAGLSITDDPAQQVFNVTMSRLQLRDTNKYWCAVEIKGVNTPDPKAGVFLTVTRALASSTTQTVASTREASPPAGHYTNCTTPSPRTLFSTQPTTAPHLVHPVWPPTWSSTVPGSSGSTPGSPPSATTFIRQITPATTATTSTLRTTPATLTMTYSPRTTPTTAATTSTLRTTPETTATTNTPRTTPPTTATISTLKKTAHPTPSRSGTQAGLDRPESKSQAKFRLPWWQAHLVACGVLLIVMTVAIATWKTWKRRRTSLNRWEMDELDSNLILHLENESDPTVLLVPGRLA